MQSRLRYVRPAVLSSVDRKALTTHMFYKDEDRGHYPERNSEPAAAVSAPMSPFSSIDRQ